MTPEYRRMLVDAHRAGSDTTWVLYVCSDCGAVADDVAAHTAFHENLQANLMLGERARKAFATPVPDERPPF